MKTQSNFNYETFKKEAIENQPIRKTIRLTDLKFHTMDTVEYNGVFLGINRSGINGLIKILGITVGGLNSIEASLGEDVSKNFIDTLKNAISSTKGDIVITVSRDRIITDIQSTKRSSSISAQTYFDTFEKIINNHNLSVRFADFNPSNGNITISTTTQNQFGLKNFKDEYFHPGISFGKTVEGLSANPFMERLICTNGMIGRSFDEAINLNTFDQKSWIEFENKLNLISDMNFVPRKFSDRVTAAIETPASLAELERGMDLLKGNSNINPEDLEIFFRGAKRTYNRLHQAGIDTAKLNKDQKRNLRTGLTVWDVINGITDFSSHNYGYEKKSNSDRHLQMVAGDMLARKNYDTSNIILNQPF